MLVNSRFGLTGQGFIISKNSPIKQYAFLSNGTDNYVDLGIVPNETTKYTRWGNYVSLTSPSTVQSSGVKDSISSNRYYMGLESSTWWIGIGVSNSGSGTADTNRHKHTIEGRKLYIDDVEKVDLSATAVGAMTDSIYLFARGPTAGNKTYFKVDKVEIVHNGTTYTWNFNEGTGATIYDNFGTPYTIQGTVNQGQWEAI